MDPNSFFNCLKSSLASFKAIKTFYFFGSFGWLVFSGKDIYIYIYILWLCLDRLLRDEFCSEPPIFPRWGKVFCAQKTFGNKIMLTLFFYFSPRVYCSSCSFPRPDFFFCYKLKYFIFLKISHRIFRNNEQTFWNFKNNWFSKMWFWKNKNINSANTDHSRDKGTKGSQNDFWNFWIYGSLKISSF